MGLFCTRKDEVICMWGSLQLSADTKQCHVPPFSLTQLLSPPRFQSLDLLLQNYSQKLNPLHFKPKSWFLIINLIPRQLCFQIILFLFYVLNMWRVLDSFHFHSNYAYLLCIIGLMRSWDPENIFIFSLRLVKNHQLAFLKF